MRVDTLAIVIHVHEMRTDEIWIALPYPCKVCVVVWNLGITELVYNRSANHLCDALTSASLKSSSSRGRWPLYVRCQLRARQRKMGLYRRRIREHFSRHSLSVAAGLALSQADRAAPLADPHS